MSKFLDLQGLKVYDEKLKRYINQKTEEISGIPTSGEKGFTLVSDGQGNTPTWQEPSGYLVNTDSDNVRTVACENFILTKGVQATIKFTTAFTSVGSASLNINNTGVIPLKQETETFIYGASDINPENPDYVGGDTGGNNDAVVVAHSHEASTNINIAYNSDSSTPGSAAIGLVQNSTYDLPGIRFWSAGTTIDSVGEDGTGKNMPKYKVKYIWTRTA